MCSAPCLLFSRCVQLPTHADNVALPVFVRRTPLLQQSIDISFPPGPQQQTRRTLLQWANGTDRRTDTVPFHRPCSAYYAGSANNNRTVDKAGCRGKQAWAVSTFPGSFCLEAVLTATRSRRRRRSCFDAAFGLPPRISSSHQRHAASANMFHVEPGRSLLRITAGYSILYYRLHGSTRNSIPSRQTEI